MFEPCYCPAENGYQSIEWVGRVFNECYATPIQKVTFAFGFLSLLTYFVAQVPQLITNHKRKSVEGLSTSFLVIWLFGDLSNALATFLTNAYAAQKVVGIYFILMDIVLLSQCAYFKLLDKSRKRAAYKFGFKAPNPVVVIQALFLGVVLANKLFSKNEDLPLCTAQAEPSRAFEISGWVFAWCSGLLYFGSRIPQLIANVKNQSVEGVSVTMFILTVLGNTLYGFSIIFMFPEINFAFWAGRFPFLLGSIGTLIFDFILLYQAYKYRHNKNLNSSSNTTLIDAKLSEDDTVY